MHWEHEEHLERVDPSAQDLQLVTTQEGKDHIRIDPSVTEDTYVDTLIQTATDEAQLYMGRQLITDNFKLHLHEFPPSDDIPIYLPRSPLKAVNEVTYTDTDGNIQTWDATKYQVNDKREPGFILPGVDNTYPSSQESKVNAVTIDFDAGYGTKDDVPELIKKAVLIMVENLYDVRSDYTVGQGFAASIPMPQLSRFLLDKYKLPRVG